MAITTLERTQIQKVFIAMLNAAPSVTYLDQLVGYAGRVDVLARDLAETDAFNSLYPAALTNEEFADRFVANFVGSTASAEAQAYVAEEVVKSLEAGISRADTLFNVVVALQAVADDDATFGNTKKAFENKVAVADYYAIELGATETDLDVLTGLIADVTPDTDVSTPEAIEAVIEGTSAGTTGQTYTLTAGADNVAGTSGNDTINGYSDTVANGGTYQVSDVINGGDGVDTLNVTLTTAGGAAIVSNVEVVNVRTTAGVVFNASAITGAEQFWSDSSSAASNIQGIKNVATLGVKGGDGTAAANFTYADTLIPNAATAGTQKIALSAADITTLSIGTATAGGNEFTTLAFDATGANRIRTRLDDSAGAALNATTTVNVTGTGSLRADAFALAATVKTVDASANTGGVRFDLSATTTGVTFKGSSGNDRVVLGASLEATDNIDGGAGTGDTVAISDADTLTAATGALVKNFEVLEIAAGDATAYTVSRLSGITSIQIDGDAATAVTTANQTLAQTTKIVGDMGAVAVTLGFSDAGVGGTEAHTVTLDANGTGAVLATGVDLGGALIATNVDNLTINSVGSAGVAANENSIATLAGNTDLNTVTITGDTDLEITATGAIAVDSIDARDFTGILKLGAMAGTAAAQIKGGNKADVILGTNQGDVVTGNAGADFLSGGAGGDVITGGAGSDLIYTGALLLNTVASLAGGTYAAPAAAAADDAVNDRIVFDTALGSTNIDKLVSFLGGGVANADDIILDDAIFTGLGTGTGSATAGGAALVRYGEGATLAAAVTASGLTSGSAILAVTNGGDTDVYFMADVTAATSSAQQFVTLAGVALAGVSAADFLVI